MAIDIANINKLLETIITLVSLGGRWAIYGKELYDHVKEQTGMTDEELRERRDLNLDANEAKLLKNLTDAGASE